MTIKTTTHLNFRGKAADALHFYQSVFGGDLTIVTYDQANAVQDRAEAGQMIWGQVLSKGGFAVMAYDVPARLPWSRGDNAVFVSIRGNDPSELKGLWEGLTAGGEIVQALAPSAWSPLYGMVKDRFGVVWILDIADADQAA